MSSKQMVIKWIKAIFQGHLISIIVGNFNRLFNKKQLLYNTRYEICRKCKYNQDTIIGEICGYCGCPLKSKLRVTDEECEIKKW